MNATSHKLSKKKHGPPLGSFVLSTSEVYAQLLSLDGYKGL